LQCGSQVCDKYPDEKLQKDRSAVLKSHRNRKTSDMKFLVAEDDPTTSQFIARGLREVGHVVDCLDDGRDVLAQATTSDYDIAIVDRMLPGLDGLSIVRALRAAHNSLPVIFLTALDGLEDRVDGLKAGGDDYLVKPFAFAELSARIDAIARRPPIPDHDTTVLTAGDLKMDLVRRKVTRAGKEVELLPREFALLETLLRRKGRVQTRTMLLESVWGISFDPQTNVVDTHISRLRTKVDKPFEKELIVTVRGAGYRIDG